MGSPVQALIHPDDGERVMSLHRGWMRGPGAETVEYRLLAAGGGWCPVETTFVAGDEAEVQWLTRRLDLVGAAPQTAAEIDPATGLPTRFSLLDRLAWALHPAGSGAAGVIVIRIDGLERLVEDRGRPATSVVLREIGRHISSALRPLDLVGQLDEVRLAAVCAGVHDGDHDRPHRGAHPRGGRAPDGRRRHSRSSRAWAPPARPRDSAVPPALLQAALQAADEIGDRGGNDFEVV